MNAAQREKRRRVRLDQKRRGYVLDGELRTGFADDPDLPEQDRIAVARWAARFAPDEVSEVQEELLASPTAERSVSLRQHQLQKNQRELQLPYVAALGEFLSDSERVIVADPTSALGGDGPGYPLSTGQVAKLTGISERQVRSWADEMLLPSFRDGEARRFYSAALIRAFAFADARTHEKAVLSDLAKGEGDRFLALAAATFAGTKELVPPEDAESIDALAEELSSSSGLLKAAAAKKAPKSAATRSKAGRSAKHQAASSKWKARKAKTKKKVGAQKSHTRALRTNQITVRRHSGGWIVVGKGIDSVEVFASKREAVAEARKLSAERAAEARQGGKSGRAPNRRPRAKAG
jgi:hypothetical protein